MWSLVLLIVVSATLLQWHARRVQIEKQIHTLIDDRDADHGCNHRRAVVAQKLNRNRILYWATGAAVTTCVRCFLVQQHSLEMAVFALLGVVAGELVYRRKIAAQERRYIRSLEFHLPMAMEQIVMAVGAGLDILPAITEASRNRNDGVSLLLSTVAQMSASGSTVEEALRSAADSVKCPAVKHAFVHIALAHKEGGEIVRPLRELSDATHSYYQETVEEEIARLPVKAVLPLVVTFTGLIICFLTVPLVQVGDLTSKVSNAAQPR